MKLAKHFQKKEQLRLSLEGGRPISTAQLQQEKATAEFLLQVNANAVACNADEGDLSLKRSASLDEFLAQFENDPSHELLRQASW